MIATAAARPKRECDGDDLIHVIPSGAVSKSYCLIAMPVLVLWTMWVSPYKRSSVTTEWQGMFDGNARYLAALPESRNLKRKRLRAPAEYNQPWFSIRNDTPMADVRIVVRGESLKTVGRPLDCYADPIVTATSFNRHRHGSPNIPAHSRQHRRPA